MLLCVMVYIGIGIYWYWYSPIFKMSQTNVCMTQDDIDNSIDQYITHNHNHIRGDIFGFVQQTTKQV